MTKISTASPAPQRAFLSAGGSPVVVLRLVVVGIIMSTSLGVVYAIGNRSAFVSSFPGAESTVIYVGFLTVGVAGVIALMNLLRWKSWALWLYVAQTLASIGLDVIAHAPMLHHVAVIAGATVVFGLVSLNRRRFWAATSD